MYVTNFQHYLDEHGNIPTSMPKEARELANFLALLIDDASTGDYDAEPVIRCIEKGCEGLIVYLIAVLRFGSFHQIFPDHICPYTHF